MDKKEQRAPKVVNRRSPPLRNQEARENQLISLAADLAEKQLREGTASSQVIVHYLRLATTREKLEKEKLENENQLLRAKTQAVSDAGELKALYSQAVTAFTRYERHTFEPEEYDCDADVY